MKEKSVLITFVLLFTYITSPFLNNVIKSSDNLNKNTINIAIADDLWDYFSRFSVNN